MVELSVSPGYGSFELAADEDAALVDDWAEVPGSVRVAPDRVGLDCASRVGSPTVVLRAHPSAAPGLAGSGASGVSVVGRWQVEFSTGQVEVWTTFSGPVGEPFPLPPAPGHRYWMQVATGHVDVGDAADLSDYEAGLAVEDRDIPDGLERFEIDFWPVE